MSDKTNDLELRDIQDALWKARIKWYNIGLRLNVKTDDLDTIDKEAGNDTEEKLRRMISSRLRMEEPCTWPMLYDALKHPTVNFPKEAEELKQSKMADKAESANSLPAKSEEEQTDANTLSGSELPSTLEVEQRDMNKEKEIKLAKLEITQLKKSYIDILEAAAKEMSANVPVRKLRLSLISLPPEVKKECPKFVKEAKADFKQVELVDDVFDVIGEHSDYLRYSLLNHAIDLYGSAELKQVMEDYVTKMKAFRKETRLAIFSEVCEDRFEIVNGKFSTIVSKHKMDWNTATLEDVEKFRVAVCCELALPLSLYDFSLNLVRVARGCVEITWRVPRSLVAYIQKSVKPSSPSMMEHHVTTLTIDGFIAYDSTFAMQGEHKVIRLEWHAIQVHVSYMMDVMSPDAVVPHLVERRLLSPAEAEKVYEMSGQMKKVSKILKALGGKVIVGRLGSFCAALVSAGQPYIAKQLSNKFHHLLKGEDASYSTDGEDLMISGEVDALPSPLPPDGDLITAQVEGTTLSRGQYNNISSLISSMFYLPTGALEYAGHTLNPLTLYWHTSTEEREMLHSTGLSSEMANEGINKISDGMTRQITIPKRIEMRLIAAAYDGDAECVSGLLETGVPVDVTKPDGWSSLMSASQKGHVEVVDKLLQHGARVDLQKKDGWSSLMSASLKGHVEVVDKLLQHGTRVDLQDKDGWSSLMSASHNGHVEVVDKLLQHGARVDLQDKDGWSSLMSASQEGHVEVVDKLLQHGARVDLQKEDGWSSLMSASLNGHVEVVDKLLQHGARVGLQKEDGWSSLMSASKNGHVEVVDMLLQHGARVDLQNEGNVTSLMVAAYHGSSEVVDVLLRARASVNIANVDNDTALTFACQRCELAIVSVLLKYGANPTVCNKEGQTPLLLATRKKNMAMVRELVAARAAVDHIEEGGLSALMLCCEEGNSEMAELLLNSQANPNLQQSSTGFTALMFACKGGHLDTVMTLMRHGANPHIKNREGMTASDLASVNEFQDVYAVLQLMDPPPTEFKQHEELQHPDDVVMEETVEKLMKRFHAQMDAIPRLSLYDSDKGIGLEIPKKYITQTVTCTEDEQYQ